MSVIKITTFGGEAPSVASRNLPATAARSSLNLNPRVDDFSPVFSDVIKATQATQTAAGITFHPDGKFLYRFKTDGAGNPLASDSLGWRTGSAAQNYVSGQVNDLRTERVYISSMDGATAPRVVDATGVNKPLGINPPAAAPTVEHTVVNQYTVDEDTTARTAIPLLVLAALKDSMTEVPMGVAPTLGTASATVSGWISHTTATAQGFNLTQSVGDQVFLTPLNAGVAVVPRYAYVLEPRFGGKAVTHLGQSYWAVPISVRGTGYTVNTTTLSAAIQDIDNPDPQVTGKLVPPANADVYAQRLADFFLPTTAPQKSAVEALNAAIAAFMDADAASSDSAPQAAMAAFYASTQIADDLQSSFAAFATEIGNLQATLYPGSVNMTQAALIAALGAGTYTWTFPDGHKELDYNSLRDYVGGMAYLGIESENPGDVPTQTARKVRVNDYLLPALNRLQANMAPAHWATFSTWPLAATGTAAVANQSDRMYAAINALRSATRQVTEAYNTALASALEMISNVFDADIAPYIPTPEVRLMDTRYYLTTLVSSWGEESAPSPPSKMLEVAQVDSVTVARPAELASAPTVAERLLTGWRIYRSNSGTADTSFQLVADLPLATTTFIDDVPASELGEVLPSLTWLPPPVADQPAGAVSQTPYLAGLCAMANGVMAGFNENVVCFSPPYIPYAYPIEYQVTTKYKIVGMAAFGQTLFVGTTGAPVFISGTDPAGMTSQELAVQQSCVSARSIVAVDGGVIYASPDGLCLATLSGIKVITEGLFTKADWQRLNPASIVAAVYDGAYHFLYNGRDVSDLDDDGWESLAPPTRGCYSLDFVAGKLTQLDVRGTAFFQDETTDTLYVLDGTNIKALFANKAAKRTGAYWTGVVKLPKPEPLAWLQVDSDSAQPVTVRWYADKALRHTATLTSNTPARLPSGRYLEHQITIESVGRVTSVTLAGSTQELQAV